ncbi:MAG: STAS domain-containing protein [Alphaproteobacteria bacterium]|nr:STAS domain-containing protein [Alphaproteobacteria bacterium]
MGDVNDGGDNQAEVAQLTLAPKLDLSASETLADALREQRGQDLNLDAGAVTHLGAHAVQTLMVATHTWAADGQQLSLTNLSEVAAENLAIMGIAPQSIGGGDPHEP